MKQKLKKKKIKKKGFTLVELLAVIVILAIIMVITVPTVLGSISEAKKSAFNTVGETMKKYLIDNYNNCKLNIGNLASYDKEIFNEQCQIRTDKTQEDLSKALIKNSGYSEKDIKEVKISPLGDGDFGVLVIPDKDGNFGEFNTYIEGTYEGDCWTIESIDNGEYKFTEFHGIDKETGEITESCGVTKEDEEYTITIPSKYNGISITTLGSRLFYEPFFEKEESVYRYIKEIKIPEGITVIESGNEIYTKDSGDEFPEGTFSDVGIYSTSGLTVKLPESLTTIGNGAFANSQLNSINIPSNVETIGDYAFYFVCTVGDCSNSKLVIPASVQSIGKDAFTEVSFKDLIFEGAEDGTSQLTFIGKWAFGSPDLLTTTVTIPASVKTIEDYAFHFVGLQPENVAIKGAEDGTSQLSSIGKHAFAFDLSRISLPGGVTIVE